MLLLVAARGNALELRVDRATCTRKCALRAMSAVVLQPLLTLAQPACADASQTMALLKEARAQLDPMSSQIADGNWDSVRNVVKVS